MNQPSSSVTTVGDGDLFSSTNLAVTRTRLALERTQLAWVRTSFTFITAGIAIDKVTEALHRSRVIEGANWVKGSHWIGLVLVIGSTLVLALAAAGYLRGVHELRPCGEAKSPASPAVLAATFLILAVGAVLAVLVMTTSG